jgi:hypothetical protein
MSNRLSQLTHQFVKKYLFIPATEGDEASKLIQKYLDSSDPIMIARFGSTEIKAVLFPFLPKIVQFFFRKRIFGNMFILSGFFPNNEASINKFSKLMIEDIKLLDILGCWRIEERLLEKYFPTAKRVKLNCLEPYLQQLPWSVVLRNKKILVIHPFNVTIENQYNNKRSHLFENSDVLPQFKSLETIKAVQTLAGTESVFSDWFEALDYMKKEIEKKDFDIAIIGCGAYGFPLAAHVKRLGKKAIHLGGPTQMLFGIKGKRWVENDLFSNIINDHFVYPNDSDNIINANKVENACYW